MSIERIDTELCDGCGICVRYCQVDVIRMDEESNKAIIRYPEDCMTCGLCEIECPQKAISLSYITTEPLFVAWG